MKIAFLTTRLEHAGFRFRVAQLLPFFGQRGHCCEVVQLPRGLARRFLLFRRLRSFDAIFIQQRLLSLPELTVLRRQCPALVYDVDDAVMYGPRGVPQWRRYGRFRAMARRADLVICGNRYIAEQASRFTDRVLIVPTAINTERFDPAARQAAGDVVTIGWTGSSATNRYVNSVFPVLARLRGNVRIKIMSGGTEDLDFRTLGGVPHQFVGWSPEREVAETATFDIGLMPLPDDIWTRGKCGCKALQYMALGIPAVCSPVGVNAEIIDHGRTGFLAETDDAWYEILSALIADPRKREEVGRAGRRRVEEAFSLSMQAVRVIDAVERAAA